MGEMNGIRLLLAIQSRTRRAVGCGTLQPLPIFASRSTARKWRRSLSFVQMEGPALFRLRLFRTPVFGLLRVPSRRALASPGC
jgi:hypothetical protein